MCGITGIYNFKTTPIDLAKATRMQKSLAHRGPDGHDCFNDSNVYLSHSRLSIIDLSANGNQPFFDQSRTIVTVTNGEIYNFQPIRSMLIEKGYQFKGTSDCEIIAYLYQERGIEMVNDIEGMFAIAIWDSSIEKLFLIRDRFGIKPLYYHYNSEVFYFGSELKSILVNEDVHRIIDWKAIHDFLSLCYIPEPLTGFENVYALEAGHYLEISKSGLKKECYWNVNDIDNIPCEYNESLEQVNALLSESVKRQLVSDAPLGAFLSGGIDSSTIVGKIREIMGNVPFDTFTVKFPDKNFDESDYAQRISKIFNTNHHIFEIQQGNGDVELIKMLLEHFDQPFGDSSAIPTYLISKKIKTSIKVALSGDGGDEIFAGYPLFTYYSKIRKLANWPKGIKRIVYFLAGLFSFLSNDKSRQIKKAIRLSDLNKYELFCALQSYLNESNKQDLYSSKMKNILIQRKITATEDTFKGFWSDKGDDALNISKILFKTSLPSDMFKKVDMMSMLAGIEVRVPLLDEAIVKYGLSLPKDHKIRDGDQKAILKELLAKFLPDDIINKRKTGFAIPLDSLVNAEFKDWIYDYLILNSQFVGQICDSNIVLSWVESFTGDHLLKKNISREGLYQRIFMLLSLEVWYRKYKPGF